MQQNPREDVSVLRAVVDALPPVLLRVQKARLCRREWAPVVRALHPIRYIAAFEFTISLRCECRLGSHVIR